MASVIRSGFHTGKIARCDYPIEGHEGYILSVTTQKTFQKQLVTTATVYKVLPRNMMISEFQVEKTNWGALRATEKRLIDLNDSVDVDRYLNIAKEKLKRWIAG